MITTNLATNSEKDEDHLVLTPASMKEAQQPISVGGIQYDFVTPPYMEFEDNIEATHKLKEAYSQHEFLLLYGYSGCGKTTVLRRFSDKYPEYVHMIDDFTSLGPSQMIMEMGKCINLPLKQRASQVFALEEGLLSVPGQMFIFDETSITGRMSYNKLELLRKIYMKTNTPICICGVRKLYDYIYAPRHEDDFCSLITRLDEFQMTGMETENAKAYLKMVAEHENVDFDFPAQAALIAIARQANIGGINAFTTIIGRCIAYARAIYYNSPGHSLPENTECLLAKTSKNSNYPGPGIRIIPPRTPDTLSIDNKMVAELMGEYKSMFKHMPTHRSKKPTA